MSIFYAICNASPIFLACFFRPVIDKAEKRPDYVKAMIKICALPDIQNAAATLPVPAACLKVALNDRKQRF
jgi:hypothetical protein